MAADLLEGYAGYLQTDDYAGYNAVANPAITQLGCWAHARRKFVEAQKAAAGPRKKAGKADMAISLIGKLYAIERRIKDLDPEARYQVRQRESVIQLQKIRDWLDSTRHNTLPKGLLGKALAYLDKNWSKLTVYVDDGRLSIDNNPAENAIRPFIERQLTWPVQRQLSWPVDLIGFDTAERRVCSVGQSHHRSTGQVIHEESNKKHTSSCGRKSGYLRALCTTP